MFDRDDYQLVRVPRDAKYWHPINRGFNKENSAFICNSCNLGVPLDKCPDCGHEEYVLGKIRGLPGVFCVACEIGWYVWECPNCGRKQKTLDVFYYYRTRVNLIRATMWNLFKHG